MTGNNGKLKEMGKLKETSKLKEMGKQKETSKLKEMGKLKEMSEMEIMSPIMDIECEQMVILGMMTDYHCLAESDAILDEECFYSGSNRDIYRAVKSVYASGDTPDLVSVNAELRKMDSGVTLRELAELCRSNAHPYDITLRAYRLKELSYRRRLRDIALRLMQESGNESLELEGVHNEAKGAIDSLFEGVSSGVVSLDRTYLELQEDMLINRDREPGQIAGTPTGFRQFDVNGGLIGGDLIVIGADTSQGKTSLATAMTLSAIKHGERVAFYSMEMTRKQLTARIASMETGINAREISFGRLDIHDIYRIDGAMEAIGLNNLLVDSSSTSSLASIISSIRRLKMKHDIGGAVVDYIQLVRSDERGLSREQEVAKIARDLKNLAKELGIWIIGISQLSRGERSNHVPVMSQLRDSGQIEEAADVVILIYRPHDGRSFPAPYQNVDPSGKALIKITKGRNIGVGEFICGFRAETTLFYPLSGSSPVADGKETETSVYAPLKEDDDTPF